MQHTLGLARAAFVGALCAATLQLTGCAHVTTPATNYVLAYKLKSTQISWTADEFRTRISHRGKVPFTSEELSSAHQAGVDMFKATEQEINAQLIPKLASQGVAMGGETTLSITADHVSIKCDEGFLSFHLHWTCPHAVPDGATYRVTLLSNDPSATPRILWSVQLNFFLPYATSKHAGALSDKIIEQLGQSGWFSGVPALRKNSAAN